VWALAAIAYECVTGSVPFKGNNGPSILLEILTKEPKPPSQAGSPKHPVPPTLDAVMTNAFKKLPAKRIPTVGALADAFGVAYGLEGTHFDWAKIAEGELTARIDARMPALMQVVTPNEAAPQKRDAADAFFGESDALEGYAGAAQIGGPAVAPMAAAPYGHARLPPTMPMEAVDMAAAGLPKKGPGLGILFAVGGGALVVGVLIVIVMLAR
jgi:serine/threonine-protein kinase